VHFHQVEPPPPRISSRLRFAEPELGRNQRSPTPALSSCKPATDPQSPTRQAIRVRRQALSAEADAAFSGTCLPRTVLQQAPAAAHSLAVAPAPCLRLRTQPANRRKERQNSFTVLPFLLTRSADTPARPWCTSTRWNSNPPRITARFKMQRALPCILNWAGISAPPPPHLLPAASPMRQQTPAFRGDLRSQAHSAEETGPFRAAPDVALCCRRRRLRHTPPAVDHAPGPSLFPLPLIPDGSRCKELYLAS